MKNALISPNEFVSYISSWQDQTANTVSVGQRVAEVSDVMFEVAPPLFWVTCDDGVIANTVYFDHLSKAICLIPEDAAKPAIEQGGV